MTQSSKQPASRPDQPSSSPRNRHHPSTGPTGSSRAGRRDVRRRRPEQQSTLQRFRTPILALAVIVVVVGVSAFVLTSAASPTYACTTIDTVQPAASGELGQVQPDMGATHVQTGDKITYPVCPPASGKHVNRPGFGPLAPKVYGPDDQSSPNGWVHNLEHGGLVLLYSCSKGGCDDASIQQLRTISAGFPNSAVCGLAPGLVGPVVARFEDMPTRFAALVWDRALYLDELDPTAIYDFFTRYAERLADDGSWLSPPEPQCAGPSPSAAPDASPSGAPESPSSPPESPSSPPESPSSPAESPSAAAPAASPSPAAS